jgi:hypothetical protein
LNLLEPVLTLAYGTIVKIRNFVRQQKFSQLCECVPTSGSGCTTRTTPILWSAGSPAGSICGPNSYYNSWPAGWSNFPPGQHSVTISIPGIQTQHDVQYDLYTHTGTEHCYLWPAGTSFIVSHNFAPTDDLWSLAFRDNGQRPLWLEGHDLVAEYGNLPTEPPCSGAGTAIPPPAPDPPPANMPGPPQTGCGDIQSICTFMDLLNRKLDGLTNLLTTVQRWRLPFAYLQGPEWPDLVDSGSVTISRLLGMRVYVVDPPPNEPVLPGNPPYLWDCGWMSINNADGMLEEKRVTRSGFDWFPQSMPLATSFNYSLTPGTRLTVIGMLPEP